ncbi:hypothetical protein [Nocardioides donggukensis]|uniref:Uncharacterized protein n=1 Tax=Nocardioides donggukensis TaxID=2774019 RepID=A0A927Q1T1_9ACTN|nr:hypothetical protein [Nocardioides donggukensis]MBD8869026.1 hypothetical protein [Nocardioides donggukensis]
MLMLLLAMLGILVLASVVVLYVAYPHRGRDVPAAPWVGQAMRRGVASLPRLEEETRPAAGSGRAQQPQQARQSQQQGR